MPTVTILDDEYMSLWYHPEAGIVHHRINKYLSDDVVVDPEDVRWATTTGIPAR